MRGQFPKRGRVLTQMAGGVCGKRVEVRTPKSGNAGAPTYLALGEAEGENHPFRIGRDGAPARSLQGRGASFCLRPPPSVECRLLLPKAVSGLNGNAFELFRTLAGAALPMETDLRQRRKAALWLRPARLSWTHGRGCAALCLSARASSWHKCSSALWPNG